MSGSLPVDTSAVTSSEINNTQLPPKILPLPNQQQPLATHFTASFGNMLPGSNIPPVAPAVSSSGLPSYYEQQLSALQNPASNQNTGAGTSMFGYNQQEVPPGVEVRIHGYALQFLVDALAASHLHLFRGLSLTLFVVCPALRYQGLPQI